MHFVDDVDDDSDEEGFTEVGVTGEKVSPGADMVGLRAVDGEGGAAMRDADASASLPSLSLAILECSATGE